MSDSSEPKAPPVSPPKSDAKSLFAELRRRLTMRAAPPAVEVVQDCPPGDQSAADIDREAAPASAEPAQDVEMIAQEIDSAPTETSGEAEEIAIDLRHHLVSAASETQVVAMSDAGIAAAEPEVAAITADPLPEDGEPQVVTEASAPSEPVESAVEAPVADNVQQESVADERPPAFTAMEQQIEALAGDIAAKSAHPEVETALKGGNLLADVRAIAAGWFRNGRARDATDAVTLGLPTPEELNAAAQERGVDVSYREAALTSLEDRDFPCVALDKQGGSHVVLGRIDRSTLLVRDGEGSRRVDRKPFEKLLSGVLFFVKPRPEALQTSEGVAPRSAAPSDRKAFSGVFGRISAEMFASQRHLMWQLVLATVLSNLFTLALPLFSMAVYDRVVPHLAWETLWALSLGVMIILATDFAIRYIRMKLLDAAGLSVAITLQSRLYSRLLHGYLKDIPKASGSLASGFREVEALCHVLPMLAMSIAVDLPFFVLSALLIYSIGGWVVLAPFVGAFVLAAIHWLSHLGEDAARKHSRYNGVQANVLQETVGSIENVKVTGSERILLRRWERLVDAASFASHMNRLQGNFSGQASVVVSQAVTVMALVIGVYEISNGTMTVGALTACTLLIGRMMTPISQLMGLIHRSHQLASAAQLIESVFRIEMETAGDSSEVREEAPIRGELSFKNVSFTYPGEQTPCLTGISLDIRPGEKIGLIGRVGSGKSTLLRLILRLHDASSGTVLIDQQDIRQINPRAVRRHFGFMRQDSSLFDDTLHANITYGLSSIKARDFERAVTLSGVKEFAARHPQGYGMRVGPRGERLSGGERQSVSLARLLAEDPQYLILDEPTAAMDNALEARIVRDLRDYAVDKTLIVATHRAPLLNLVDRIIWMEGGRIIADGPKDEVMRRLTQSAA